MLDEVAERHPQVGWDLLIGLLPQLHGFSSPAAKPKLREGGAVDRPNVSVAEYRRGQSGVVARTIALAGDEPARWTSVIKAIANFTPDERRSAADGLDSVLTRLGPQRVALWRIIRDEVAKHEGFRDQRLDARSGCARCDVQRLWVGLDPLPFAPSATLLTGLSPTRVQRSSWSSRPGSCTIPSS